ncbi:hypothetical protein HU200_019434 [Digitaria exilis]|uniref:Bifunctional inhibitor/plant lipid transfer protein/seed storage helical domain-containing protein n=1 Tax=Digitaria exilis TaxID=1010633 RepID=A0A835F399_9POAL|nr:hypothetical protein HU200_019434 [Digitaria exilis]CAB3460489.1 unnamed protein product [Digitaria exilis]
MRMLMVLAVLALASSSSSAQQTSWNVHLLQYMYGAGEPLCPCAEFLRQPQCSPVAAPYYATRQQTMWQPSGVCQPLRRRCCQHLRLMDAMSRCQAMCGVVAQFVALQGGLYYDDEAPALTQQWRQLLPVAQAPMAVAQAAQSLPAMCGLYQLPSYCTIPCALSAAIPPY